MQLSYALGGSANPRRFAVQIVEKLSPSFLGFFKFQAYIQHPIEEQPTTPN